MSYTMSFIEYYLHSLPQYRHDRKRSFIEIFSFNGLRTSRKVIEFDGNTVLCRVCGDRASGFHYGVHACEGCKGFFRRSIQQKIQYRPCVKNQHCLITRVNRNRCQYCRLKKCIAIGMSRDAVRFGRVPKREKAKIMEQMQKVNLQCQNFGSVEATDDRELMRRIIEAYEHTCRFTSRKAAIFKDEARRKGSYVCCPSKMACPLNPTPDVDHCSLDRWSLYSNGFMPAIHNVVTFAKLIPGFTNLNQDDQIMLLKTGTFEILLVQLSCLFDSKSSTMFFTNEKIFIRKPQSPTSGAGYLLGSVFDFSDRMTNLNLTDSEMALFSAYILFSPDRPGLHNCCLVERLQSATSQLLKTEIAANHPGQPDLFDKLLTKIPEMRLLNTVHSEKLLGLDVPSSIAHQCPPTHPPPHPPPPHHPLSLYPPPVPEDADRTDRLWTNQRRGLLTPSCHYYLATALIPADRQGKSARSSAPSDERAVTQQMAKRKLTEDSEASFETQRHPLKSEITSNELPVNCHRVSPYSPAEVVLSTPLGTFHRIPSTPWTSDHQRPPVELESFDVLRMLDRCERTETMTTRSFKDSPAPLPQAGNEEEARYPHPKKKVVRVWSRDSFRRTPGPEDEEKEEEGKEEEEEEEEKEKKHSSEESEGKQQEGKQEQEECDSTDWTENSKPPMTIGGGGGGGGRKFFSDFNINSRFLTREGDSTHASLPPSGFPFAEYAFPMALWSNGSVESAPFFLPPRFSASDGRPVGFDAALARRHHHHHPLLLRPETARDAQGSTAEKTRRDPNVRSPSIL